MAKYRKKPISVEAVKYEKGMEDGWVDAHFHSEFGIYSKMTPYIDTLEGKMLLVGDYYIVTGVEGERWAVRKDIFEETYELVDEEEDKERKEARKILTNYSEAGVIPRKWVEEIIKDTFKG